MKIHSPSMSELHAFTTTARLGSFTKAAEALCVTQGAVSRSIARLEEHFGQPLLARGPQGLSLTCAGRRLADATAAPLLAIESISAEMRAPVSQNRLSLAVVPTLASVWLVPRLPQFHLRHPEITLSFAAYRRDEDFSGALPHAAILSGVPSQWPNWHCDYVLGREMVVICHPDRLGARQAAGRWKTPAELLDEPLLYHSNAPENWPHWFNTVGIHEKPQLGTGLDQVSIIVRAVMADMGVAVLQRSLILDEINAGRVVVPFDIPVSLDRGYVLCCPQQRKDHPALRAFREWLLEAAADVTKTDF
ncbi:LysR family transcriptional regulator [Candidimonas sp. SYP-B2681]|uniref:LysR substrate-binding domain-containing protein n=1 Tax=Candidimonas sp. SYP-B2681 TaxID=2497686 RepID=UPI000F89CEF5|nr:LysR substrate-binding domain-containing protein [Candidimonas sp. SYP-B2681]RTZ45564.1 LysR family transcriptional regulator [Candidimonas sp. SYP-B2681]